MRLRGRQARFLTITLCLWTIARGAEHWLTGGAPAGAHSTARPVTAHRDRIARSPPFPREAGRAAGEASPSPTLSGSGMALDAAPPLPLPADDRADRPNPRAATTRLAMAALPVPVTHPSPPADAAPAPIDLPRAGATAARPWTLDGYLFVRPGSGRAALSPTGQLGGSQVAARATYRVATIGPVAIAAAARVYAPLQSRGAEVAGGVDLRLGGSVPVRLSIERRQRIDAAGRSAWSAYIAGGIYREAGGIVLDGYGQTGMVGLRRRDVFVDGALRAGRKISERLLVGGAVWGAAQPGVARLDIGPRAAWRLPIADHGLTLAIEGRLRVAGQARPGNGVAVTLAADL